MSTVRERGMVVLARKKHEAILIDGGIRVEVVHVGKATVRVRLRTPRTTSALCYPGGAGKPRQGSGLENTTTRIGPGATDDSLLTLINQQVVRLGESISLGVVDADSTRVLFFIDAPLGMSVAAVKPQAEERPEMSDRQNLLPFMSQPADPCDADDGRSSRPPGDTETRPTERPEPKLLPFPVRELKRKRL